jgi:histidine triad (HIT) family protein
MSKCVFCEIVAKRMAPDLTVFEDEHVIGQISLQQKSGNHGHALVIPKFHVQDIYALPKELHAPLMSGLRLLARASRKAFGAEGIQIRQNNERAAGQDVFHLHFHVIPRYQADDFEIKEYERLSSEIRREHAQKLIAAISHELIST